ncbi:hypothetical protein EYZ11_005341 [Aspergillus tanneri]|uniref:Uncharacterized protein n=1 Tax=Aspergillus tanneri TaxID=1220188 RepID=A0A4S3JIK7_9EURO|nr:hypothetical protein EYZ11_005341 [Aspergillus tanneri]
MTRFLPRLLRLRLRAPIRFPHHLLLSRTLSSFRPLPVARVPLQCHFRVNRPSYSTNTFGKSESDLIVDELEELYETAKDEFEIATESTDSATIYAASDRESAREALNQLLIVFQLYTQDPAETLEQSQKQEDEIREDIGNDNTEMHEESRLVETSFDPWTVRPEVRVEVRRRVAQRVRELKNAVELLEERASAD